MSAVEAIRLRLRVGQLIVLESTTYPGTTREVVLPALEPTGLVVGRDFFLCFSPERINPGDRQHPPATIPQVIGGVTPQCAELAAALLRRVAPQVNVVSSPEAAEMVKLLENTFRAVNIGLVNELALMCRTSRRRRLGSHRCGGDEAVRLHAVLSRARPWRPLHPDRPAVSFLESSDQRLRAAVHRARRPGQRVDATGGLLDGRRRSQRPGRSLKGSSIIVLGVSYKRDVNDARESPAIEILAELSKRGAVVTYHDPYVPELTVDGHSFRSVPLDDKVLSDADCVLIVTDHTGIDYKRVVELAKVVVDTRNATRSVLQHRDKIVKL